MTDEIILNDETPFNFWIPLYKSKNVPSDPASERMVEGVAATPDVDQQQDIMDLSGMDFTPFLEKGWINWNHQEGPEYLIGKPIEACIKNQTGGRQVFFIKAALLKGQPKADAAWSLIENLSKAGWEDRLLGWSVQGGILQRSGPKLIKRIVRLVALTHEPVNSFTFAHMCKSLTSLQKGMPTGRVPISDFTDFSAGPVIPPVHNPNAAAQALRIWGVDNHLGALLWGECSSSGESCYDPISYRFYDGRNGIMDHLVLCRGLEPDDAKNTLVHIINSGIFG